MTLIPTVSHYAGTLRMLFRGAHPDEIDSLIGIDQFAQTSQSRRSDLANWISRGEVIVAEAKGSMVGFVALNHEFFSQGFVVLVCVAPSHRRQGYGLALLRCAESRCKTGKLFTSTNASNSIAQALLLSAGFVRSGIIENLDDEDSELIYFKACAKRSAG